MTPAMLLFSNRRISFDRSTLILVTYVSKLSWKTTKKHNALKGQSNYTINIRYQYFFQPKFTHHQTNTLPLFPCKYKHFLIHHFVPWEIVYEKYVVKHFSPSIKLTTNDILAVFNLIPKNIFFPNCTFETNDERM